MSLFLNPEGPVAASSVVPNITMLDALAQASEIAARQSPRTRDGRRITKVYYCPHLCHRPCQGPLFHFPSIQEWTMHYESVKDHPRCNAQCPAYTEAVKENLAASANCNAQDLDPVPKQDKPDPEHFEILKIRQD